MHEQSQTNAEQGTTLGAQPERNALCSELLAQALLEVPCAECGRYAMTLERANGSSGSFECPACHKRTYAVVETGHTEVFSETRLARLLSYAQTRPWFCPDHAGVRVTITKALTDERDPRRVALHYLCRRGWRFWGRRRVHEGVIPINLAALEIEMLSHDSRHKIKR